jgi:hypothetical protein
MVFSIRTSSCLSKRAAVSPSGRTDSVEHHSTANSERARLCVQTESPVSGGVIHENCFVAF